MPSADGQDRWKDGTIATLAAPLQYRRPLGISDDVDAALVAAVRAGDDRAFEALYDRYRARITGYIEGMVRDHGRAEDVAQEVFLSALRRIRATDSQIVFKPWVYEIAKNACIDAFRRSRHAQEVSFEAAAQQGGSAVGRLASNGPTPDVAVDARMSLDHLRGAFGGLSDVHHQILVMRELEGLSYSQIGKRLDMSKPAVESTLFRARRRLTEEYEDLVSGRRCVRVQSIIADSGTGAMGARDERAMARHVSHCQSCRREAAIAGFDLAALARKTLRGKVAALLPLPAGVRRRWLFGGDDGSAVAAGWPGAKATQWAAKLSLYGEQTSHGWGKAAALVATVAVVGVGAGAATHPSVLGLGADGGGVQPSATAGHAPAHAGAQPASAQHVRDAAPAAQHSAGVAPAATVDAAPPGPATSTPATSAPLHDPVQSVAAAAATTAEGASRPVHTLLGGTGLTGGGGQGSVVDGAADAVQQTVSGATGAVQSTVAGATGAVNATVQGVTGAVNGVVDQVTGPGTGAVDQTVSAATGAVNGAATAATGAVNGAASTATGTAGSATGAAAGAVKQVTGAVGGLLGHR